MLEIIKKSFMFVGLGFILSSPASAMTVWAVQSGDDPFSLGGGLLSLSPGSSTIDVYYNVDGDTSYGYLAGITVIGDGAISNISGGDSYDVYADLVDPLGWDVYGGAAIGETGSSVLAFSFDFTGAANDSVILSGTYTDAGFIDTSISSTQLLSVSSVPVPAAAWLFGSAIVGLAGLKRRR